MEQNILNRENVFIIAELSANHNGSLETALETIRAAKRTGADAIKLQTYTADTITLNSRKPDFMIEHGTIWDGQNLHDLYDQAHTPWEWHKALFEEAEKEGLYCFSSPFDPTAVDFLEDLNCPAYKVASAEITDIPLIEYIASKGKPIILSTGMANEEDIELALNAVRNAGNQQIGLLKCTSSYPAPIEEANLIMIQDLAERFNIVPGLSDHTMGYVAPIVSVCFGARVIEKHFILDHTVGGPDASFSLDEKEFTEMVKQVRQAESAIGNVNYTLTEKMRKSRDFSRSLYVVDDIETGEVLTNQNIRSIRPGYGIHPKFLTKVLGQKAAKDLDTGTPLQFSHLLP
ncbi:pseudaminic acid synthase [Akkermansiaceae bacterium]|nr:pseudaminic acid synthase [Akkermansiaceae bacterium]